MPNQRALLSSLAVGLSVALLSHPAAAQVHEVWRTSFDAAFPPHPMDDARPLARTPSGAIYQVGSAFDGAGLPAQPRYHVVLTKRDASGSLLWNRIEPPFLSTHNSTAALAVTAQDVAIVAGTTTSYAGPSSSRRFLFRVDAAGALVSSSIQGSGANNHSADLGLAANDDALVVGMHDDRFVVERLDAAGSLVWRKIAFSIPTTFQSRATAMATNAADEIWAVGTHDFTTGFAAPLARFGPDGTVRWLTEWPGGAAADVAVDDQDRSYVCVLTDSAGLGLLAVVALDAKGLVRWVTYLPGPITFPDLSARVLLDRFGRIVVVGRRGVAPSRHGLVDRPDGRRPGARTLTVGLGRAGRRSSDRPRVRIERRDPRAGLDDGRPEPAGAGRRGLRSKWERTLDLAQRLAVPGRGPDAAPRHGRHDDPRLGDDARNPRDVHGHGARTSAAHGRDRVRRRHAIGGLSVRERNGGVLQSGCASSRRAGSGRERRRRRISPTIRSSCVVRDAHCSVFYFQGTYRANAGAGSSSVTVSAVSAARSRALRGARTKEGLELSGLRRCPLSVRRRVRTGDARVPGLVPERCSLLHRGHVQPDERRGGRVGPLTIAPISPAIPWPCSRTGVERGDIGLLLHGERVQRVDRRAVALRHELRLRFLRHRLVLRDARRERLVRSEDRAGDLLALPAS